MNIISYVRDKKGNPRGALIAFPDEHCKFYDVSWSFCSTRDRFTKAEAKLRAKLRHENNDWLPGVIPHSLRDMLPKFVERCNKYYKGYHMRTVCNRPKRESDEIQKGRIVSVPK